VRSRPSLRVSGQRGFTLLEVLVALAILGTAVVVSIQAVGQGLRLLKAAGDQQRAIIVADHRARELLVPVEGTDSGTEGRFSWQRTSRVLETPDLTPANAPQKWRVFQISVIVTWDEQRRLEVSTLRTVPATSDPTRGGQPFGIETGTGTSSGTLGSEQTGTGTSSRTFGRGQTGTGTSSGPAGGRESPASRFRGRGGG
jgi:general secretion pathway protein I